MYVLLSKRITISTPVEVFVGRDRAFSWACNFAWVCQTTAWVCQTTAWVCQTTAWVCQTTAWVGDPEITERVINALMRLCSISCTKSNMCIHTHSLRFEHLFN